MFKVRIKTPVRIQIFKEGSGDITNKVIGYNTLDFDITEICEKISKLKKSKKNYTISFMSNCENDCCIYSNAFNSHKEFLNYIIECLKVDCCLITNEVYRTEY